MSELGRKIHGAAAHVRVNWSEARAQRVERNLLRRRRRRVVARSTAIVALLALVAAGGWTRLSGRDRLAPGRIVAQSPPSALDRSDDALQFDDGSVARPVDAASLVRATATTPQRVVVQLARGGARFAVTRNPSRLFRVEAGRVAVEVVGTRFEMQREGELVRVVVVEGRVRVLWPGGLKQLGSGDSGLFPPRSPAPERPAKEAAHRAARSAPEPSWQDLAQDGDYDEAYDALQRSGAQTVADRPAELLLAADVARLSRHPAEAVAPLTRVLAEHRQDPRAPLAAFTLGRVLLDELGRPTEAAQAFAQAESLAPDGPLAQDAIAREVEALSRAGDAAHARARAEAYVKRYPDGRRLRAVRRFGGIE